MHHNRTTEPPILASDHPLRRAFFRYGYTASRHWLACILLSVAVAVFLCYPVFFLYENPTTGFSKLPLHVWTSARLYDGNRNVEPDIAIRQIWVHGNYMGALNKKVLVEALNIQNILVPKAGPHHEDVEGGPGHEKADSEQKEVGVDLCSIDTPKSEAAGFHSPLMFWNCSQSAILHDEHVLDTIYEQRTRRSYLNLTLRPTSVFAGKSFAKDKVVAADALVLTMFGRETGESANTWEQRVDQLSAEAHRRGNSLYPGDGHVHQSRLYEFQQKPLSFQDNFFLLIAYPMMALYVVSSLGKLRAVKSWAGLLVTIMFETALSITASFSLCGLLKIDLARIPDAAYPFVVLVMGLENMFRLINAVLAQKPELPVAQRIATALSEVGHLALATAAQMLFVLWLLAKVAPSIAPFCVFAAMALSFDFIFHLTFFLAVLSVDVRRMELSDSIDRSKMAPPSRKQSVGRQERVYWLDAALQNRLPFSSRIAGSAISICFLLGLNMHFYESGNSLRSLVHSVRSMFASHSGNNVPFIAPPINQARTPAAWLRIQDYRYAQEVLQYVRPTAHSIVARVYDPLVIVLKSSNRTGHALQDESFFSLLWSLFRKHLYPFLLAVIFSVAFVTLLMQYLLWNELPDEEGEMEDTKTSILRVENLPKSHRLDVIHIAACSKGHLVSVSLDRLITFSLFDQRTHQYSLSSALATAMTPAMWPIVALTIDDSGTSAALCSQSGDVLLWNMLERRADQTLHVELNGERPILFSLVPTNGGDGDGITLLVGTSHGHLQVIEHSDEDKSTDVVSISSERLALLASSRSKSGTIVAALTKSGRLRISSRSDGTWVTHPVEKFDARFAPSSQEGVIKSFSVASSLDITAVVRLRVVDLIDIKTKTQIHSFPAILVRGHSLRILHSPIRKCKTCGESAVHSLSLAYTDFESQSAMLRTYTNAEDQNALICLAPRQAGKTYPCKGFAGAKEHLFPVEHPGTWEAINNLAIAGIRMRPSGADTPHSTMSTASGFDGPQFNLHSFDNVKKRSQADGAHRYGNFLNLDNSQQNAEHDDDDWEVWTMTASGDFHVEPLHSSSSDNRSQSIGEDELLVAAPGPVVRLGQRSVAVGFGNRVKVVMIGNERFEQDVANLQDISQQASMRRRKPLNKRAM